jgi:hypothetical protein
MVGRSGALPTTALPHDRQNLAWPGNSVPQAAHNTVISHEATRRGCSLYRVSVYSALPSPTDFVVRLARLEDCVTEFHSYESVDRIIGLIHAPPARSRCRTSPKRRPPRRFASHLWSREHLLYAHHCVSLHGLPLKRARKSLP